MARPIQTKKKFVFTVVYLIIVCIALIIFTLFLAKIGYREFLSLLILIVLFLATTMMFFIGMLVSETSTAISDESITRRTFWGKRETIKWSDVTLFTQFGYKSVLRTAAKSFTINLEWFEDPDLVLKFIQDRLGESK